MPEVTPIPHGARRSFELHECLGRGGFGEVYRATMIMASGVRTVVAVKVLRQGLDPFGQSVQRLRDEAHLLSALDHPAILKVHDLVLLDERVGLITEYIEGIDFSRVLQKERDGFGARAVMEVIAEVATALDAAWSRTLDGRPMQLVHRDIKPANVRLGRHGQVKLLDFGIARANIEREASTTTDTLLGTYQYMAPERFGGAAGPAGDVFALGCLLFEGLAGRRFLHGLALQQHYAVVADRGNFDPMLDEQVGELPGSVPAGTRNLLRALLAYHPDDRPTAGELPPLCEAEAALLRGVPLRTWARERVWASDARSGELSGKRIDETAQLPGPSADAREAVAAPPSASLPAAYASLPSVETVELSTLSAVRRRRPQTPFWVWGLLLLALFLVGGGAISLALAVMAGQAWTADAPITPGAPVPSPIPAPLVAPATPAPPAVPEPIVAPSPVGPAPSTAAAVRPEATAWVMLASPVPVHLVDQRGARHDVGSVPPGDYTVRADFGDGHERAGSGTLLGGQTYTVRCKKLVRTCSIE